MNDTERLAALATQAAREFEAKAARKATPLEIADLVLHLHKTFILWPAAELGKACKLTFDALNA